MPQSDQYISLDVGERRIGVARGDSSVRIAQPLKTIEADGQEIASISAVIEREHPVCIVIGYPRNQSGEATAQTRFVEHFADKIRPLVPRIVFQDESLTSVTAETRLKSYKKPYTKADIDAEAAAIILQDFLDTL